MLASHWLRHPATTFHRGYTCDPDSVPIECFRPQLAPDWFIVNWQSIGIRLVDNWHLIGNQLETDWLLIGI